MENLEYTKKSHLEERIRSRLKCVMSLKGMTRRDLSELVSLSEWQVGEFFRERPLVVVEVLDVCSALNVDASWVMFSDSFDLGRVADGSP